MDHNEIIFWQIANREDLLKPDLPQILYLGGWKTRDVYEYALKKKATKVAIPRGEHIKIGHLECSLCGSEIKSKDNYCRNCGAEFKK